MVGREAVRVVVELDRTDLNAENRLAPRIPNSPLNLMVPGEQDQRDWVVVRSLRPSLTRIESRPAYRLIVGAGFEGELAVAGMDSDSDVAVGTRAIGGRAMTDPIVLGRGVGLGDLDFD